MLKTPVEMILSSRRPLKGVARGVGHTQEVERLKLSALVQLQKQVSPWGVYCGSAKSGEGSGVKLHGTGRSPFVNRLQTPLSGNAHYVRQRGKRMGVGRRGEREEGGERERERKREGERERGNFDYNHCLFLLLYRSVPSLFPHPCWPVCLLSLRRSTRDHGRPFTQRSYPLVTCLSFWCLRSASIFFGRRRSQQGKGSTCCCL